MTATRSRSANVLDAAEQAALRDSVRSMLARARGTDVWSGLADAGALGVTMPEACGGVELGTGEEMLIHAELGRALSPEPYLTTVGVAVPTLRAAGGTVATELLTRIARGQTRVCAAISGAAAATVLDAEVDGADLTRVTGELRSLAGAPDCDTLLVAAHSSEPLLCLVERDAPGVAVEADRALDITRSFGSARLADASATVVARGANAAAALHVGRCNGLLALAAETVGAAEKALELTVAYVRVRRQFGEVIGTFQGVKHRVADMLVALEGARATVLAAIDTLGGGDPLEVDRPAARLALALARTETGRACFWIARETVHLHGGTGYTWEHDAHRYFRRTKSNQQLLDPDGRATLALAELAATHYLESEATA